MVLVANFGKVALSGAILLHVFDSCVAKELGSTGGLRFNPTSIFHDLPEPKTKTKVKDR